GERILLPAPRPVAVDVRIVSQESLIGRRTGAQREIGLDACRELVELERREQGGEALRVADCGVAQRFEPLARRRTKAGALERHLELRAAPLELPQREVQPAAPFAERGLRLREQPGDARDERKVDAAPGAIEAARRLVERCAVTPRARK